METMKPDHKNATKPGRPANALGAELAAMEGIPVYQLYFESRRDLPVGDSNGGMGKLTANDRREITYLPKAMLYRIVDRDRDPKAKPLRFYIPREWAAYVPLEDAP